MGSVGIFLATLFLIKPFSENLDGSKLGKYEVRFEHAFYITECLIGPCSDLKFFLKFPNASFFYFRVHMEKVFRLLLVAMQNGTKYQA